MTIVGAAQKNGAGGTGKNGEFFLPQFPWPSSIE